MPGITFQLCLGFPLCLILSPWPSVGYVTHQCILFSSGLGIMEAKKLYLLPGCCLDGNEIFMATSTTNAKMLKNLGTNEDECWLRRCFHILGDNGGATRADHMLSGGEGGCQA
jgi:hypothetical protein